MNIDLSVEAGIVAWFLSGPLYMPIIVFGCITPITVKADWLSNRVRPTTAWLPNRSSANSSPKTMTRRFSSRSRRSMKRPPTCGMMLRSSPKAGSTPRIRAFTVLAPTLKPRRTAYSRESAAISGMRSRSSSASSSVKEMARPDGRPAYARVVAPGHRIPMPSPIPFLPLWKARFKPSPNESSRTIESVPHAIASTVRAMRLVWRATSVRNRRKTSSSSVRRTSTRERLTTA